MVKKRKSKRRGRSAAFMRSINPRLKKKKSRSAIKLKRGYQMAKRRKVKKSRRTSKKSSILGLNAAAIVAPMLYGAVRGKTSALIAPYTAKIPLGTIGDEVGMYALATIGKKYLFKKAGVVRDALTAGQVIEMARIGEALISGELGLFGNKETASNGNIF